MIRSSKRGTENRHQANHVFTLISAVGIAGAYAVREAVRKKEKPQGEILRSAITAYYYTPGLTPIKKYIPSAQKKIHGVELREAIVPHQ